MSLDLFVFGVLPLESNVLALIPLFGLIAGVVLGVTAPLRRRDASGKAKVSRAAKANPDASDA